MAGGAEGLMFIIIIVITLIVLVIQCIISLSLAMTSTMPLILSMTKLIEMIATVFSRASSTPTDDKPHTPTLLLERSMFHVRTLTMSIAVLCVDFAQLAAIWGMCFTPEFMTLLYAVNMLFGWSITEVNWGAWALAVLVFLGRASMAIVVFGTSSMIALCVKIWFERKAQDRVERHEEPIDADTIKTWRTIGYVTEGVAVLVGVCLFSTAQGLFPSAIRLLYEMETNEQNTDANLATFSLTTVVGLFGLNDLMHYLIYCVITGIASYLLYHTRGDMTEATKVPAYEHYAAINSVVLTIFAIDLTPVLLVAGIIIAAMMPDVLKLLIIPCFISLVFFPFYPVIMLVPTLRLRKALSAVPFGTSFSYTANELRKIGVDIPWDKQTDAQQAQVVITEDEDEEPPATEGGDDDTTGDTETVVTMKMKETGDTNEYGVKTVEVTDIIPNIEENEKESDDEKVPETEKVTETKAVVVTSTPYTVDFFEPPCHVTFLTGLLPDRWTWGYYHVEFLFYPLLVGLLIAITAPILFAVSVIVDIMIFGSIIMWLLEDEKEMSFNYLKNKHNKVIKSMEDAGSSEKAIKKKIKEQCNEYRKLQSLWDEKERLERDQ